MVYELVSSSLTAVDAAEEEEEVAEAEDTIAEVIVEEIVEVTVDIAGKLLLEFMIFRLKRIVYLFLLE